MTGIIKSSDRTVRAAMKRRKEKKQGAMSRVEGDKEGQVLEGGQIRC